MTPRVLVAGLLYFLAVYATGWILGPIRALLLVPRFGPTIALFVEAPVLVAAMWLAARWSIRRMRIWPSGARLGMGLEALGLLLVAEAVGVRWVRGLSLGDYVRQLTAPEATVSVLLPLMFAAMPSITVRQEEPGSTPPVHRRRSPRRGQRQVG